MKLVAFLQLYNELENGHLEKCLSNCAQWSNEIFIYDDNSTDGSYEYYLKYTDKDHIIVGDKRDFSCELFHKQQLLNLTLQSNPDWIGWIDGDAVFCREITENCTSILENIDNSGFDSVFLHNLNLWRHPAFYRVDSQFDSLHHCVFWKNNGNLHYSPSVGLHQRQYPLGIVRPYTMSSDLQLLHYGFASLECILRKYYTYKQYGQRGEQLDRLVREDGNFTIKKVPIDLYSKELVPSDYNGIDLLSSICYDKYKRFASYEEYIDNL